VTTSKTDLVYGRRGGGWSQHRPTSKAPLCEVCHQPMVGGQRRRHELCDPTSTAGRRCTCPTGCTLTLIGDGPARCSPDCTPCRIHAGRRHRDIYGNDQKDPS
jgi:hypothetical protein